MIDYILVAIIQYTTVEFEINNTYTTYEKCMDAKENLRDLRGVYVLTSTCIKREIK